MWREGISCFVLLVASSEGGGNNSLRTITWPGQLWHLCPNVFKKEQQVTGGRVVAHRGDPSLKDHGLWRSHAAARGNK